MKVVIAKLFQISHITYIFNIFIDIDKLFVTYSDMDTEFVVANQSFQFSV